MLILKISAKIRAITFSLLTRLSIHRIGKNSKLLGVKRIQCTKLCIGDGCWIQAVEKYKKQKFSPVIKFGECVMMSNNVHISAVKCIVLGNHVLLGSNIYIGDHSHGSTRTGKYDPAIPPAQRELDDISDIYIGDNVWVCDGAVILAGSHIGSGSIVAAQSLVKGNFPENCLIAGSPAKIIKRLV